MEYQAVCKSPVGYIGLACDETHLIHITYLGKRKRSELSVHPITSEMISQIECYFNDSSFKFNIPYRPTGTPFQQRVWNNMLKIPAGNLKTYGELANDLNTSARAIGNACRANPLPLLIPCHRIIAQSHIGGFMGKTSGNSIDIKHYLIKHEINNITAP